MGKGLPLPSSSGAASVTQELHLITKLSLRKRAITQTINDQLNNICQIEHYNHRSPINFLVNLVAGLIVYCHQPKKPSLWLHPLALSQA